MTLRFKLSLFSLLVLTGCALHHAPTSPAQKTEPPNPGFLDIQTGSRLRVIIPVLKSGGYVVHTLESTHQGTSIDLHTADDYIGYENDYYWARRKGVGVRIEFQSAEIVKNGSSSPQSHPTLQLFRLPSRMIYVRLVYLIRESATDHNAAIVGADAPDALNSITHSVQSEGVCQTDLHTYCSWVPVGVGIQPEKPKS